MILASLRKMEFRSGKETSSRGRETSWDIIIVIQRNEDSSLYQGIASVKGTDAKGI